MFRSLFEFLWARLFAGVCIAFAFYGAAVFFQTPQQPTALHLWIVGVAATLWFCLFPDPPAEVEK